MSLSVPETKGGCLQHLIGSDERTVHKCLDILRCVLKSAIALVKFISAEDLNASPSKSLRAIIKVIRRIETINQNRRHIPAHGRPQRQKETHKVKQAGMQAYAETQKLSEMLMQ